MASRHWSEAEVEAAVQDYLKMLTLEVSGQSFNKAERNRDLRKRLDDRSHQAVEYKHANISAVLDEMGLPFIGGYKPRRNAQALLRDVVRRRISPLLELVASDVDSRQERLTVPDVLDIRVDPPRTGLVARDERAEYLTLPHRDRRRVNYVEREAANQSLGDAGELLIMEYEQTRLERAGKDHLAKSVEHVSKTQGDHLGYDIHSYEKTGRDRFVEVKTTRYGKLTPFYISANELQFSKAKRNAYQLYRVFEFRKRPKLFTLPGDVETHMSLRPINYRAYF